MRPLLLSPAEAEWRPAARVAPGPGHPQFVHDAECYLKAAQGTGLQVGGEAALGAQPRTKLAGPVVRQCLPVRMSP